MFLIDFLDSELWTEKLYDHGNLYCIEIIIIVNQIKLFKLNSLISIGRAYSYYWPSDLVPVYRQNDPHFSLQEKNQLSM